MPNGEYIDIVASTREQAERLSRTLEPSFATELVSETEHVVRVTPDSETAAKLVSIFHAIGAWLTEGGQASCDVRFGERSLTVLAAASDAPGDPTMFLIERTRQLERALASRIAVEQAKGILSERDGVGVDTADDRLRASARSSGRELRDVAGDVLRSREGDLG